VLIDASPLRNVVTYAVFIGQCDCRPYDRALRSRALSNTLNPSAMHGKPPLVSRRGFLGLAKLLLELGDPIF
jgi:hypothetical protein